MSGFAPTPEQARAADPRRSVWVTANAGTGKTRVLADRVLRLLLDGANPEGILCLTFTKAAAVEMTERIEHDLAGWAVASRDGLSAELTRLEGVEPDDARLARARRLFAQILDLPQGLPVMTIHSFCASLLRRFPLEAGIAPHFDQIDDRSAAELMHDARMWLLGDALSQDHKLADAVNELTAIMAEMTLTDLLQSILYRRGKIEAAIRHHQGIDEFEAAIDRHLGADPNVDVAGLVRRACTPTDIDVQGLRNAGHTMVAEGSKTDQQAGQYMLNWLALEVNDRVLSLNEYKNAFLTQKGTEKKRLMTKKLSEDHPGYANAMLREQVRLIQLDAQIKVQQTASRSKALARIAHALISYYTDLKSRDAALDFDDLIEKTAALLATKEQRDWVLYKLDARLEHLLVDEAQDTSPTQWQIVERLLDEFAAGAGAHDKPRTLFVVGDEKQSIYSFQGADLANFRQVAARIKARLTPHDETLAKSFRTSSATLEIVDRVLELDEVRSGLGGEQLPAHQTSRIDDQGEVLLWPLVPPSEQDSAEEPWALPGARRFEPTAEEQLARHLADEIEQWLQASDPLPATGRRPAPGDVLILVSRRGRIQELIIRALKHRNIPVAGADRMQLSDHIAVQDLIALGHSLLLPEDSLTLACLLKSPLVGLDEEALFTLAHDRGSTNLIDRLRTFKDQPPFADAHARFEKWLNRADFVPPYELYCGILNSGGRERLLARLGPDAAEPIEAFLAQALAYEEGHPATLQGFLHWLTMDDQTLKRDPEPARSEVRVMTVHGAKGLEAPFVILADAASPAPRHHSPMVVDDNAHLVLWRPPASDQPAKIAKLVEMEDERRRDERARLLYVALTRAKDRLLIAGWSTRRPGDIAKSWYPLIESAFDRCTGINELAAPPWAEGQTIRQLSRGSRVPPPPMESIAKSLDSDLPQWATPIATEPEIRQIRNPSRHSDKEPSAPSPSAQSGHGRHFGIELHRLLHQLADIPAAARDDALQQALAPLAGEIDTGELTRQVFGVLNMPLLAPVFGPGSRAEQPIIGRIGATIVSGQIDRMAVTQDEVMIVDFKSNRRPPREVAKTPVAYLEQLAAYRSLLMRIYPGKTVRCGLVWTAHPRLDVIPAGLLDAISLHAAA